MWPPPCVARAGTSQRISNQLTDLPFGFILYSSLIWRPSHDVTYAVRTFKLFKALPVLNGTTHSCSHSTCLAICWASFHRILWVAVNPSKSWVFSQIAKKTFRKITISQYHFCVHNIWWDWYYTDLMQRKCGQSWTCVICVQKDLP